MPVLVPLTLDDALDALSDAPDATLVAGGTDVMVEINGGYRKPSSIIALNRVTELRSWSFDPAARRVRLGAAVTYREVLDDPIATWVPALAQAARTVGSPQIRWAATIGGNVATASPAGDGLPVLAALDATVRLRSKAGQRDVAFADFMVGPKRTVRAPGEIVESIDVPILDGWQGYAKVGVRNAMVISAAGACLAVDSTHRTVRIALGSVGPTILRCAEAEAFVSAHVDFDARQASSDVVAEFSRRCADTSMPIDDHRSTAAYRRHAIGVLAGRLLRRAFPS
jgi:CO/xanthine dehydrogenase FAD-binding subunit